MRWYIFLLVLSFLGGLAGIAPQSAIAGQERFQDKGDGTVLDTRTNLMWVKDAGFLSAPVQIANSVVREMNVGKRANYAHSDWRIPRVGELLSLVDTSSAYPALTDGHPFESVRAGRYWSSTGGFNMAGYTWAVDMSTGTASFEYTSYCNFFWLWPVRSAGKVSSLVQEFQPKGRPVSPGDVAFLSMKSKMAVKGGVCTEPDSLAPPASPAVVTATPVSPSEIVVAWEKGAVRPAWFNVYADGIFLRSSLENNIRISGLEADTTRCFTVAAYSSSGVESARSPESCAKTWSTKSLGTVWSFGLNSFGQLGDGTRDDAHLLVQVQGIKGAVSVVAGVEHTAAVGGDGALWLWGRNSRGQLGDGSTQNSPFPRRIGSMKGVRQAALGWYHSLALLEDGTVYAWGRNYYGQLGDGSGADNPEPVRVSRLSRIVRIAAGWYHSLALKADGTVWAWGWDLKGQLGNAGEGGSLVPVVISGLEKVKDISGGMYHSLALLDDGTVWAWGSNEFGQVGDDTSQQWDVPVQVKGVDNVKALAAGMNFSLALLDDGTVWAWGRNDYGQLGSDDITHSYVPVRVPGLSGIKSIAAGAHHALAVGSDGALWLWGWDFADDRKFSPPHQVGGFRGITSVAAGIHFTTMLKGR